MKQALSEEPATQPRRRAPKGEGSWHFRADKGALDPKTGRRSGLWQREIELAPVDGRRQRRVIYGATQRDVLRKIADLKARGGGTIQPPNPTKLGEYVETWLDSAAGRGLKAKTIDAYRWAWAVAKPVLGHVRLERLGRETALSLFDELQKAGKSANTVRAVARVMQTALADAIADGAYTAQNPFAIVSRRKPKHRAERGRALTVDECRRFIKAARDDRFEAAWLLGLFAGLRIGEMFGLRWSDVDVRKRTISVRRQVVMVGGKAQLEDTPKTPDSERLRPIEETVVDALKRRRAAAKREGHASPYVFPSIDGGIMSTNNARRRNFGAVVKSAGIAGSLTPHDLRHTYSSLHHRIGTPERVTSEGMGHADSQITRRVYTSSIGGDDRAAAKNLERFVGARRR